MRWRKHTARTRLTRTCWTEFSVALINRFARLRVIRFMRSTVFFIWVRMSLFRPRTRKYPLAGRRLGSRWSQRTRSSNTSPEAIGRESGYRADFRVYFDPEAVYFAIGMTGTLLKTVEDARKKAANRPREE